MVSVEYGTYYQYHLFSEKILKNPYISKPACISTVIVRFVYIEYNSKAKYVLSYKEFLKGLRIKRKYSPDLGIF